MKLVADISKTLGFLSYIQKLTSPVYVKPKLDNACVIWNPHRNYLIELLESIQNRVACFICSDYDSRVSISAIKSSINYDSLIERRKTLWLALFRNLYTIALTFEPPF